jgi:hypothetical protein
VHINFFFHHAQLPAQSGTAARFHAHICERMGRCAAAVGGSVIGNNKCVDIYTSHTSSVAAALIFAKSGLVGPNATKHG